MQDQRISLYIYALLEKLYMLEREAEVYVVGTNDNNVCIQIEGKRMYLRLCDRLLLPDKFHVACTKNFSLSPLVYKMATFQCASGNLIAASFQCDGVTQCRDGDDEDDCPLQFVHHINRVHDTGVSCSPLALYYHKKHCLCPSLYITCGDGRCIPQDALCNGYTDCSDGWDEVLCIYYTRAIHLLPKQTKLSKSEMRGRCTDGKGSFHIENHCFLDMDDKGKISDCTDGSHLQSCHNVGCPTAFKCNTDSYCIPVRKVCDGVIDCGLGEDEVGCEDLVCNGMLQCRESGICIPPWEVCDGVAHCSRFIEDEAYCFSCPSGMRCHGNAAVVLDNYSSEGNQLEDDSFLPIKSLSCNNADTLQIIMNTSTITHLILLNVSSADINSEILQLILYVMDKLAILDTSHNSIAILKSQKYHIPLRILDLSFNILSKLQSFGFKHYSDLMILILHHNPLTVIARWAFEGLKSLQAIDLTFTSLKLIFVSDLPRYSPALRAMESDHRSFCCVMDFISDCLPKTDSFSSCENLLSSNLYRGIFTFQAICTLIANLAVIVFKSRLNKQETLQMINLTVANLLMSLYLCLLTAVDIYYRGHFSDVYIDWVNMIICQIMAAISFISSELSLFFIMLMSCIRAYVIHNVWKKPCKRTIWLVSISIWISWAVYVLVLFMVLNHLNVYVENNICILVFFIDVNKSMITYIHSLLFVVINIIIVLTIIISYTIISWNIFNNSKKCIKALSKQKQHERRKKDLHFATKLFAILLFSLSCWIPVIVSVLLATLGLHLPDDLAVWMALLVIPINASFCPIMFGLLPMIRDACSTKAKPDTTLKMADIN